jgi:hypothetical protein
MQITISEVSPLNLLAWAIACTLTIAIFLLYYQFIYKTEKRDEKRIHSAHFYPTEFISDSKISTFQFYDQKWSRLIGGALTLILTSILAPVIIGIPAPLNAFACLLGVVTSLWLLDKWASNLATAERSRNVNTTYLPIHCLFPAEGEQGVLLKETDIKNEVVLSEEQAAVVVDSAIEGIQTLSIYDPQKVNLKKLRAAWLERMKGLRIIRAVTGRKGKYHIVIIARNPFASMKTPDVSDMIAETVNVRVPLAPMFAFYIGPTTRVFRTFDDKGSPIFTDRKAGVFVDLFDLAERNELLLGGGYIAPVYTDALLGEFLHLVEQNFQTATSMTKTEMSLDKANKDLDEKEFDGDIIGIVAAAKEVNKYFVAIEKAPSESRSFGKLAKILIVVGLIVLAAAIGFFVSRL